MVFQKAETASNKSCRGSQLQVKSTKPATSPGPDPNPAVPQTSWDTMKEFILLEVQQISVTHETTRKQAQGRNKVICKY